MTATRPATAETPRVAAPAVEPPGVLLGPEGVAPVVLPPLLEPPLEPVGVAIAVPLPAGRVLTMVQGQSVMVKVVGSVTV